MCYNIKMKKVKFVIEGKDKKKNKSFKLISIDLPIYRCGVLIASREQSKQIEKTWNNLDDFSTQTRDYLKEGGQILISIRSLSDSDMVHELYHCVDMIFQRIEETHIPVSETRAYLMAHLFDEYKKIKKFL